MKCREHEAVQGTVDEMARPCESDAVVEGLSTDRYGIGTWVQLCEMHAAGYRHIIPLDVNA